MHISILACMLRPVTIAGVVCLVLLMATSGGRLAAQDAQQSELEVAVEVGLGGWFRPGRWMPVRILARSPRHSCTLVTAVSVGCETGETTYAREMTMPAGAQKSFFLHVRPGYEIDELSVRHRAKGDVEWARTDNMPVNPLDANDTLIVCNTAKDIGLPTGKGAAAAKFVVACVAAASMPTNPAGYGAADMVVFVDPSRDSFASPEAADAIVRWMLKGGHVVIVLGPGWQGAVRAPFAQFMPAAPEGLGDGQVSGTVLFGEKVSESSSTPFAVCGLGKVRGTVHASDGGGKPLVVSARAGFGRLTLVAFIPDVAPFLKGQRKELFWKRLVALYPRTDDKGKRDFAPTLSAEIMVDPGSFFPFALIFAVYVALLWPGDYYLSRFFKRPLIAWATSLLWAGMCLGIVIMIVFARSESQNKRRTLGVLTVFDDEEIAYCTMFDSFLSGARGEHTFKADGEDGLIGPLVGGSGDDGYNYNWRQRDQDMAGASYDVYETSEGSALTAPMFRNSVRMFESQSWCDATPFAGLSVKRTEGGSRITLANDTKAVIVNAIVVTADFGVSRIVTDVAPGSSIVLDLMPSMSRSNVRDAYGVIGQVSTFLRVALSTLRTTQSSALAESLAPCEKLEPGEALLLAKISCPVPWLKTTLSAGDDTRVVLLRKIVRLDE
ncbi:MAG: hypothetical protein RDV41_07185 [Planctomycetota bacterium]|nr:hypothetical protein [Planctomycetota bacterium]